MDNIYKSKRMIHEEYSDIPLTDEDKFKYCLPLKFNCKDEKCQSEIILKNIIIETVIQAFFSFIYIYFFIYLLFIVKFYSLQEINYRLLPVQIQIVRYHHGHMFI